jgi:hypothetical protein
MINFTMMGYFFALCAWTPSAWSGRMVKRMKRIERIKTDFFPPAADKDEPKVSQNPFLSV